MVTKYDLYIAVNHYFITTLTTPRHPLTPDAVAQITMTAALKLQNFENNQAYTFYQYIKDIANYYGVDLKRAAEYYGSVPGLGQLFIDYIRQNTTIVHAGFDDVFRAVFRWVGETAGAAVSNLLGSFLKKLLPIALVGFAGYIIYKETNKRYRKAS